MSTIITSLQNKKISPNSLKLYMANLKRLNDGKDIKNINFLKNIDDILKKLEHYKKNTQRTYLISIVSLLKQDPSQTALYNKYYKLLMDYNKELQINNNKSETQIENWIDQSEVLEKQKELENILPELKKNITSIQYDKLLNLVILSLYTLNPPRRNLDYLKMNIINKFNDDLSKENNFLELSTKTFIFRNYKTKKTYQDQVVKINDELFNIIEIYLKYHPLKSQFKNKIFNVPFLVNFNGEPFNNSNEITRILNKIFGKKIGASMLRTIYLSNKYSDNLKNLNNDSSMMGTSSETIQNNYIKTD